MKVNTARIWAGVSGALLLLFSASGMAGVVYKAVVNYSGGYTYSFDMAFATAKSSYTAADLIGGDFQNQVFTDSSLTSWTHSGVDSLSSFSFTPGTGNALTFDIFATFYSPGSLYTMELANTYVMFSTESSNPAIGSPIVSKVPAPAALSLLGIGLAGLAGMRRRATQP